MNINEVVGQRLKACRKAKGLSQDGLAKMLEYTDRSTIAKMESGKNAIHGEILPRLAQVLGVTEAYLSAKLYETLYVFGVTVYEDPAGNVRLLDTMTNRAVEYTASEWLELQSADAFRDVWAALTGDGKEPTPVKESEPSEIQKLFDQLSEPNQSKLLELCRLYLASQSKTEET